jgi:hypothetical protein
MQNSALANSITERLAPVNSPILRVGQNPIHTVFHARKSANIRSYTVHIYTVLANPTHVRAQHTCTDSHTHTYTQGWPESYIYTYMTVYLVISLPKIPYIHRIYKYMVLVNPTHILAQQTCTDSHTHTYKQGWPESCIYTI